MGKRFNDGIERHRRQLSAVRGVVDAHSVLGVGIGGKGTRTPDL
jgi:hypothetical protein